MFNETYFIIATRCSALTGRQRTL